MQITLIAIGKMKNGAEKELFSRYFDRANNISRQTGISKFNIVELGESQRKTAFERKIEEANAIKKVLPNGAIIILLDERGKSINSKDFASKISNLRDDGTANLCFIIGGADGLEPNLLKQANFKIGFSALTWPHQLVRIMLMEQLYRAMTILNNHPYHRI